MTSPYSKKFELKFKGERGFSEIRVESYAGDPINLNFSITSGKRNIDRPGDKYESTVYNLTQSHYVPIERHKLNIYFLGVPKHQYNHIRRMWEELSILFPQLKSVQMPWDVKTSVLAYLALQESCPFSIIQSIEHFMGAYIPHSKGQYAKNHIVRFHAQHSMFQNYHTLQIIRSVSTFMMAGRPETPEDYYLAHKDTYHAISGKKVIDITVEKFYEWISENPPRKSKQNIDDLPLDR